MLWSANNTESDFQSMSSTFAELLRRSTPLAPPGEALEEDPFQTPYSSSEQAPRPTPQQLRDFKVLTDAIPTHPPTPTSWMHTTLTEDTHPTFQPVVVDQPTAYSAAVPTDADIKLGKVPDLSPAENGEHWLEEGLMAAPTFPEPVSIVERLSGLLPTLTSSGSWTWPALTDAARAVNPADSEVTATPNGERTDQATTFGEERIITLTAAVPPTPQMAPTGYLPHTYGPPKGNDRCQHTASIRSEHDAHTIDTLAASVETLATMVATRAGIVAGRSSTVSGARGPSAANSAIASLAQTVAALATANTNNVIVHAHTVSDLHGPTAADRALTSLAKTVATLATANIDDTEASPTDARIDSLEATVNKMKASLQTIKHTAQREADTQATTIAQLNKTVTLIRKTNANQVAQIKRLEADLQAAKAVHAETKNASSAPETVVPQTREEKSRLPELKTATELPEATFTSPMVRLYSELIASVHVAHKKSLTKSRNREASLAARNDHLAEKLKEAETALEEANKTIVLREAAVRAAESQTIRLKHAYRYNSARRMYFAALDKAARVEKDGTAAKLRGKGIKSKGASNLQFDRNKLLDAEKACREKLTKAMQKIEGRTKDAPLSAALWADFCYELACHDDALAKLETEAMNHASQPGGK